MRRSPRPRVSVDQTPASHVLVRFGEAGSAIVFMVWTYYASLILFLGAEITHAATACLGERTEPEPYARPAVDKPSEEPRMV